METLMSFIPMGSSFLTQANSTGFGMETLMNFIPMGSSALTQATSSLDLLMKGFPAVLKSIDPSIKADIKRVNSVIASVCDKIVSEASGSESTFSYYSSEGMKATCDSINKVSQGISQGLDDPAVTLQYVDKLKQSVKSVQDQVDVFSSL